MQHFTFADDVPQPEKSLGSSVAVPAWLLYGGLSLLLTLIAEHTRPRTVVITVPDPHTEA